MLAKQRGSFFQRTKAAKRIMVLDLGFLGDTVHSLPMLWTVRQSYPEAELHVAVAAHVTTFMACVPWVDRVWGYARYPHRATLWESIVLILELRRERFDAVINLNGSDRSGWLTFFSGARERLGRVPARSTHLLWRQMFTERVEYPSGKESLYQQKIQCLALAGFPRWEPKFHVQIADKFLQAAGIARHEAGTYFHISPFTTADKKELSPAQLVELIMALAKKFSGRKLVLSCAATEREQTKMARLLELLPENPWRVFAGNLDLPQITAVIKHSAMHFSGDTGTLHIAVMTQTPTVTWFWANPGMCEWTPAGENNKVLVGANPPNTAFLADINTDDLVEAAEDLLYQPTPIGALQIQGF